MSTLPVESTPLLAGIGLIGAFALVVGLALSRDEATVAALEADAAAAPSSGRQESSEPAAPSASAAGGTVRPAVSVTASALPKAKAGLADASSVEELKAFLAANPDDTDALAKLAQAQSAQANGMTDALATLKTLFGLAPKQAEEKELSALVTRAAMSTLPGQQDAALALMSDAMGSVGLDLLFELASSSTAPKNVKQRALEATKRPEVRKRASPALKVALDLRDQTGCGRSQFIAEAERAGDRRALPYLLPLQARKGCGFLGLADCYACLGTRAELTKAINAINAR